MLKTGAATAAVTLAAPALVRDAFSSSGEVDILMWSDYLPDGFIAAFTKETGIVINYTGIGSNEEIINKMKANKGQGADICSPTNNRNLQWAPLELLQPIDMKRVKLARMAGTSTARAHTGCRISGAPKVSAGARTSGRRKVAHHLMAMCGRTTMPARPWAVHIR
jgi:spermidine/putrescine transport system substrate-binding protein